MINELDRGETMAGDYGRIDSRADFFQVLNETRQAAQRLLLAQPASPAIQRIDMELDAMKQWSDGGRTPTEEERERIDIGLVAVRELSTEDDMEEFCQNLHCLEATSRIGPTTTSPRARATTTSECM